MIELKKYPIFIESSELEIIKDLLRGSEGNISEVWKQLLEAKNPIFVSAYETGFLMSSIADNRNKVPNIWRQLLEMVRKFREDAGVKITRLDNNFVQLTDKDGFTITREKYDWE